MSNVKFAVKVKLGGSWLWCRNGDGKPTDLKNGRGFWQTAKKATRQAYADMTQECESMRLVRITRKPKPKPAMVPANSIVGWRFKMANPRNGEPEFATTTKAYNPALQGDTEAFANTWSFEGCCTAECERAGLSGKAVPYYADGTTGE